MIKLSGNDVTFGENTVSQSGQRMLTKSGIRGSVLSGKRVTGFHWNGHRFPPPTSGSVLYMPGYPAQGSTMQDFSGEGNDGTVTGAVYERLPSGLIAPHYDGGDDLLNLGNYGVDLSDNFTLEIWLNSDIIDSKRYVFGTDNLAEAGDFYIRLDTDEKFSGIAQSAGQMRTATVLAASTWYHLVASVIAGVGKFYWNGIEEGTSTSGHTFNWDETVYIAHGYQADEWDGLFALPRIHSKGLSAEEAGSHYSQERHLFGV